MDRPTDRGPRDQLRLGGRKLLVAPVQDAGRIPLASDTIFVEPNGSSETTLNDLGEVAPFLERQTVDSIRVHHTLIDGEWDCELTGRTSVGS